MSWVLVALVLLIVALLIHFLRQIVETVAKNRYYPPSDAIIDQVLPEEVFEHVLSFADPLMLLRCQSVSKYWHYQASKRHIKSQVLTNAIDEVRNLPQIRSSIRDKRIWMKYSPNYKIEHRLADFALAKKENKHLLEIERETPIIELRDLNNPQKYIIKILGRVINYPSIDLSLFGTFAFSNGSAFASVIHNKNPSYYHNHELYEILAPLDKCQFLSTPELLMCRPANPVKKFGFIALDSSFVKVMALLFTPLIVHDVLYSKSFLNILKQWFGTASFLFLITWYYFANKRMANTSHGINVTFFRKLTMINIALAFIGLIALHPSSTDHFAFVAIFVSLFAYGFFVSDHVFEYVYNGSHGRTVRVKNNNELKLFATILALVIFMNDWKSVYKSILDQTIFNRLFRNTTHYAIFVFYCIWNNSMLIGLYAAQAEKWRVFGRFLFNWDRGAINLMLSFYAAVVFATLYAPYWTGA